MRLTNIMAVCGALSLLATFPTLSDAAGNGCIVRDPAGAWFNRDGPKDRQATGATVLNAAKLRNIKVADPCLTGNALKIPEAGYASLAKKRPDLFRPIADSPSSANGSPNSGRTTPSQSDYQYNSLDTLFASDYVFGFSPVKLDNAGRIFGNGFYLVGDQFVIDAVFFKEKKIVAKFSQSYVNHANDKGTGGGAVLTDLAFFYGQAALFRTSGVELIPRRPGEVSSEVVRVTTDDIALVASYDSSFNPTYWIYDHGTWTAIHLEDVGYNVHTFTITNGGYIVGNAIYAVDANNFVTYRVFRLDPKTGTVGLFAPVYEGDTDTYIEQVNVHDELVGWSYIPGSTEHVGVWSQDGTFTNYFTEGTPAYPTISNSLRFSDNDKIVVFSISRPKDEVGNVYIVPQKGVRFNLLDTLSGLPDGFSFDLLYTISINNRGDMVGQTYTGIDFFIERTNHSATAP